MLTYQLRFELREDNEDVVVATALKVLVGNHCRSSHAGDVNQVGKREERLILV